MASSSISLFLVLSCALILVSATPAFEVSTIGGSMDVPADAAPNANIPQTANEPNTLSVEKEMLPAMVPVNPAVPSNVDTVFKPNMPTTPIASNPAELINKPEHFEQSIQKDDISNVEITDDAHDNLNIFKNTAEVPLPVNAVGMNLVSVFNVLDDLKNKLDQFKDDIIQLAQPIGLAAQMTVFKPEVEMIEVRPEESNVAVEAIPQQTAISNMAVKAIPQQPDVANNVNGPMKQHVVEGAASVDIPSREARSPYGGYGGYGGQEYGVYERPGYGVYGRPGTGVYGRPGYGDYLGN